MCFAHRLADALLKDITASHRDGLFARPPCDAAIAWSQLRIFTGSETLRFFSYRRVGGAALAQGTLKHANASRIARFHRPQRVFGGQELPQYLSVGFQAFVVLGVHFHRWAKGVVF